MLCSHNEMSRIRCYFSLIIFVGSRGGTIVFCILLLKQAEGLIVPVGQSSISLPLSVNLAAHIMPSSSLP